MQKRDLLEINKMTRPSPIVKLVVETAAGILGAEPGWQGVKRLFATSLILERLRAFDPSSVTKRQYMVLRKALHDKSFDEEHLVHVAKVCIPLGVWCRALGVYLKLTKFQNDPAPLRPLDYGKYIKAEEAETAPTQEVHLEFHPDITAMNRNELENVVDLEVRREGVGSILFHGTVDCRDIDFNHVVRLGVGEVLVYPDGMDKPPVGEGLNRMATVTMLQCWPPSGVNLHDPRSEERYRRKIQAMTEKKNARFLDYETTTGVWRFQVLHF
jgi:hypothetical protein